MPESNPIPTLLAFLLCDTVIQDAATKKRTLVGVFDRTSSPIAPFAISLGLYAKLVEGAGDYEVKVRLVNLKDESPVMELQAKAQWVANGPMEIGLNIAGIVLPEYGIYEVQLLADNVYLGRAVLTADKLQLPIPPPGTKR